MEKVKIDGYEIRQPDSDLAVNFETTYSEDSGRLINGDMVSTSLFTVLQLSYATSNISKAELALLLSLIIGKNFTLHYYNPYFGAWRDDVFYVGKGSLNIGCLLPDGETFSEVSFNMEGVNPLISSQYWDDDSGGGGGSPAYRNVDNVKF